MSNSPTILIYGSAPDLIDTRRLVLKHAGFDVTVSLSLNHTTELLTARPFDLLLLCHSLFSSDCESALVQSDALRPETKRLILCKPLSNRLHTDRDTYLVAFASPDTLIAAVRDLTAPSSLPAPPREQI